jgi:hypothetical protein
MRLDALLTAHAYMKVERPPELWEADTEDVRFIPLLGEMIASALSRGAGVELGALTLNASNVEVSETGDDDGSSHGPPAGQYVAVTVSGRTDLGPDSRWRPNGPPSTGLLGSLAERLVTAGVRFAYIRRIPPTGSITVFLDRLSDGPGKIDP